MVLGQNPSQCLVYSGKMWKIEVLGFFFGGKISGTLKEEDDFRGASRTFFMDTSIV